MTSIQWRDEFNLDVDEIDAQHRRLAELVNQLHQAVERKAERAELMGIFDALLEHTRLHFATEERLMQDHGYPGYDQHKAEHDQLLQQLEVYTAQLHRGHGPIFVGEMDVSNDWVMLHLLGSDKQLGVFLKSQQVS